MIEHNKIDTFGKMDVHTGNFISSENNYQVYFKTISHTQKSADFHVLILHDFLDYHGRYERIGHKIYEYFDGECSIGWLDFHGHGLSNGMRGHIEEFKSLEYELEYYLKNCIAESKVFILGAGLGGTVALSTLSKNKKVKEQVCGSILVNPLLDINLPIPGPLESFFEKDILGMGKVKFSFPFNGHDLIDDIQVAEDFDSDPLVSGQFSVNFLIQVKKAMQELRAQAYYIDIPSLFFTSERDVLGDASLVKLFIKSMEKDKTTHFEYPKVKHDILNSSQQSNLIRDMVKWIKQRN